MAVELNTGAEPNPMDYPLERLLALTPIDGRYRDDVVELEPYGSEFALFGARAEVETRHLIQLSKYGVLRELTSEESDFLSNFGQNLTHEQGQRVKALEAISDHDVQAVEMMLRESMVGTSLEDLIPYTHLFLTSEDVNNLAYRLLLDRATKNIMVPAIRGVIGKLVEMAEPEVDTVMDGRTHGQKAVPTILAKEEMVFATRAHKEALKLEESKLSGKLNGAVGNFNAHMAVRPDVDWQSYAQELVESFGFEYTPVTTQIQPYEDMIEVFQTFLRVNNIFVDLDQDMWRYISDHWMAQEVVQDETGSSTMAQKVNPIKFENSEGNLLFSNSMFEFFGRKLGQSRLQRDLTDSTVVRNVPMALAYSLVSYKNTLKGLGRIYANHKALEESLQSDWSTLTEAVQSQMRMDGDPDAYDKVKKASRGKQIEAGSWREWVDSVPGLKPESAAKLKELTPDKYIGIGPQIARQAIDLLGRSKKQK